MQSVEKEIQTKPVFEMAVDKEEVCRFIEREITKKQGEITELENREKYFLTQFASYWAPAEQEEIA